MISKNLDVRQVVSKEVYAQYGEKSAQFVSDNIVRLYEFIFMFFNDYYKKADSNVERVEIMINNWATGGTFNNRGLRTFDYIKGQLDKGIKTAKLSQHIGGSTNAIDFNVVLHFKGGKLLIINSNEVYDIILKHEKEFIAGGLTTLENKTMTQGWTHADCRFTGLQTIYIVNP